MAKQSEREKVLSLYESLRLTDVCDGMDAVGLQDVGLMDKEIRPLWRDLEQFRHRICGIAHTVQFVPTGRRAPSFESVEKYHQWKSQWYDIYKGITREGENQAVKLLLFDLLLSASWL